MNRMFIGIGAQKCASSWIYDILKDHPDVNVSEKKELDFFSYNYELGYKWYESHFNNNEKDTIAGEVSPSYFNEASVPYRLKQYMPEAKIILSLRNPVERALSQHRHLIRIGYIQGPDYSFEEALNNNPSYIEQGLYATHLTRWLEYFPLEQIHVVTMEEISQNSADVAKGLYEFLGVDTEHISKTRDGKSNISYALRNRSLDNFVVKLRIAINTLGFGVVWKWLGNTGLRHVYRSFNRRSSDKVIPTVKNKTKENLRQHFKEQVELLEQLLGRSFEQWK